MNTFRTVGNYALDVKMNESDPSFSEILNEFQDENSLTSTFDLNADSNDNITISSTPEPAQMHRKRTSSKQNSNETAKSFELFLNNATEAVSRIGGTITKPETSTAMLFSSLALKIENANFPYRIVNKLEMEYYL